MQRAGSASGNMQFSSRKMKSLQLLLAFVLFFAVEARILPIEQLFQESGKCSRTNGPPLMQYVQPNCETDYYYDVPNVDIA